MIPHHVYHSCRKAPPFRAPRPLTWRIDSSQVATHEQRCKVYLACVHEWHS